MTRLEGENESQMAIEMKAKKILSLKIVLE